MIIPGMVHNTSTLQLEYITMKTTKLMSVNNIGKTTNISKNISKTTNISKKM